MVIDPTTVTMTAADDIVINAAVVADDLITLTAGTDGSGGVSVTATGSLLADNVGDTADITITTGATSGGVSLAGNVTLDDVLTITSNASSGNGGGVKLGD